MKRFFNIWVTFVLFVFFILTVTGMIAVILRVAAQKFNYYGEINPHNFEIPLITVSVILGTTLSAFFGKKFLKQILALRDAMKKVASGDFSVRVEGSRIPEFDALLRDFNKMVRDLGSIQTLRDDFVTSVSHEIKTPVAAIEGCVELLRGGGLTPAEEREYIGLISLSTKRLSSLTSDILRLSKLENQEILPDQKEYSLDEQIRQAVLLLEPGWSAKGLRLNIYLDPVRIYASKDLLMQVWVNLIDNAVKFSDEGGTVSIELFTDGKTAGEGRIFVKIEDHGCGMDEETLKHIFQKFYQGDSARAGQGNGFGLALVKRIVELSGGTISAQSRPERGSVFTVELR